jgi:DNA gyrase/topoisomerase IV subunit B
VKILGLNYGEKYANKSDLSKLRYGKLMIMADQDQDGSHIKGLVINFIHYKWPNLLKHDYVEVFITPILKVSWLSMVWTSESIVVRRYRKVRKCSHSTQCLNLNNGKRQHPIGKNGNANTTKVYFLTRAD